VLVTYVELARILREAREHAKLTQQELAERLGVTRPAVTHFEQNRRKPSLTIIEKWATICGRRLRLDLIDPQNDDFTPSAFEVDLLRRIRRLPDGERGLVDSLIKVLPRLDAIPLGMLAEQVGMLVRSYPSAVEDEAAGEKAGNRG